jgi:hypothetical protein
MSTFKDSKSETWDVSLTIGAVLRIKKVSNGKFDLLEPTKDDLCTKLNSDYGEFFEVLWLLVEPQARTKAPTEGELKLRAKREAERKRIDPAVDLLPAAAEGITAEEFGERLASACLLEAQRKFFEEWASFFHGLQRAAEGTALEKMQALTDEAAQQVRQRVMTETAGLVEKAAPKFAEILNKECGNLQALLASKLSLEPSENCGT